ncbi:hypothetical protein ILUMI_14890 [Ignelater luminosus]|uniref:Uncharacterized protein n=1 Tax=Ignelater luminosus TaxID=2038154 RepID=A0A8K0GAH6_IGNLU|nr:hypothetical protein ILUMI_14890 [Ignelater luminosus]
MDKTQDGFPIHDSVRRNNFRRSDDLLRMSSLDVDMQNEIEDTSVLTSLKYVSSHKFIKRLLAARATISMANDGERVTPIGFAITPHSSIAHTLLENNKEKQFLFEYALNEKFTAILYRLQLV